MNYTECYKQIYAAISKLDIPHENINKATLRITDALNDIFVYTKMQFPSIINEIMDIVEDFSTTVKLGGYDLDDKS